jgi:hypothetical protein
MAFEHAAVMRRTGALATLRRCLAGAALLALSLAAHAAADGRTWDSLTPEQQKVLEPMQEEWSMLPPRRQEKLAHRAARWSEMTPAQRDVAKARMDRWKSIPPEKRRKLLERRKQFEDMGPEQRERLREKYENFRKLPPERQQAIRDCVKRKAAGEDLNCKPLLAPAD